MHLMPDTHGVMTKDEHVAMIVQLHDVRQGAEYGCVSVDLPVMIANNMVYLPAGDTVPHFRDIRVVFEYEISQIDQDVIMAHIRIDIVKQMAGHLVFIFEVSESSPPPAFFRPAYILMK